MSLLELLLLLAVAAILGSVGQSLVGWGRGGALASIALGFIGAVVGRWLAHQLGLPELFVLQVGGQSFPIVWTVIGAALLVALASLVARGRF